MTEGKGPMGPERFEGGTGALRRRVAEVLKTPRFTKDFGAAELEEEDLMILDKAEKGQLERNEFNHWKAKILSIERSLSGGKPISHQMLSSRGQFMGFLSNALELGSTVGDKDFYRLRKGVLPD